MSSRIKKLFFHEMRSNIWFLLIGMIIMSFSLIYLYINVILSHMNTDFIYSIRFGSIISENICEVLFYLSCAYYFGLALMTIFQFSSQKEGTTREFMFGLPYKRNELLGMKYFAGSLTITIPIIFYAVGCLILRNSIINDLLRWNLLSPDYEYFKVNETVEVLLLNILMFWLTCIALYSIYMLMQVLIHPPKVAMAAGIAVAMVPSYILNMLGELTSVLNMGNLTYGNVAFWFGDSLGKARRYVRGGEWNSNKNAVLVVFNDTPYYIISFLAIIVITTILSFIINKKHGVISRGVFSYPIVEKTCLICLGICCGLTVASIPNVMKFGRISMVAMILLVGGMSVFLAKQAINRYSS